ncbi:MAG: hypothetical protein KDD60_09870, partial [Bdellovibrionales bacterium]|nr:hypothetical protein [Bdellovibrionales bacterium]
DPWLPPPEDDINMYDGWSFGLIRSEVGHSMVERAVQSGALVRRPITREEAMQCNHQMSTEKRWRAFRVIETHRRQGKSIPNYGRVAHHFPRHGGLQFIETEFHMLSHIGCFLPQVRGKILWFFLRSGGYYLLWLNSLRRRLKIGLRDTLAYIRRKLFGRKDLDGALVEK